MRDDLKRATRPQRGALKRLAPGVGVVLLLALAAQFLADHYGAPALLMALLLGLACHFLHDDPRCAPGVDFVASAVLRAGVALLGARMSVEMAAGLGAPAALLMVGAAAATILLSLALAPLLGRGWPLALITGGAVAICGASAAAAIAAILPRTANSDRDLTFTVIGVTLLSTLAMIAYPVLIDAAGLPPQTAGVIIGGAIHDVAQVVGAGFSISDEVGETATVVKLIRVALLAPVVILMSIGVRRSGAGCGTPDTARRPPLVPGFLVAFLGFAAAASTGLAPAPAVDAATDLSRWALLAAIAAVGVRTSLRAMTTIGGGAVLLIVANTLFLGAVVTTGAVLLFGG